MIAGFVKMNTIFQVSFLAFGKLYSLFSFIYVQNIKNVMKIVGKMISYRTTKTLSSEVSLLLGLLSVRDTKVPRRKKRDIIMKLQTE